MKSTFYVNISNITVEDCCIECDNSSQADMITLTNVLFFSRFFPLLQRHVGFNKSPLYLISYTLFSFLIN